MRQRAKTPGFWLSSLAMVGMTFLACTNNERTWDDDDDDDGGSSEVTSTGTTFATTGGMGGMAGVGGNGATTGGQGAGPPACTYPDGPYGVGQGQIVPPTLSWTGFAPGSTEPTTFTSADLFDCDGSGGINAVIVDTSQYG